MWNKYLAAVAATWFVAAMLLVGIIAIPTTPTATAHVEGVQQIAPAGPIYNVVDFGAIGDGNPANAAVNTVAFQQALSKGTVYVPVGKFVVNNGMLTLPTAGQKIYGEAQMGANPSWGAVTSTIIGKGPGHTLRLPMVGCFVQGLAFQPSVVGEQKGTDAYIQVENTQTFLRDISIQSPNIGIAVNIAEHKGGQFWVRDVLVQGTIGYAGIACNNGGGTAHFSHVIMFADSPQPPYGIVVTSAGELQIDCGCDIINCGNCLALVPGLNGVPNQEVTATTVSGSLFDSGNGAGCVYVCPTNGGYILKATFTDVWASTGKNAGNTNGFTFDGSQSKPAIFKPIQNVKLVGCTSKSFTTHCGLYARGVDALSITASTFGDNFNGIQLAAGCTNFLVSNNHCGPFVPASGGNPTPGNLAYGVYIEAGNPLGICTNNVLTGNRAGGLFNAAPGVGQIIGLNLQ